MKVRNQALILTAAIMLGTSNFTFPVLSAAANLTTLQNIYEQNPANSEIAHNYAVALARNGQFVSGLNILKELTANHPDPTILYDHAVVLTWAGDYRAAVSLYETKILNLKTTLPHYVTNSLGGAYYRLGQFKDAQSLFHQAAAAGDPQAKRWEAESFMQLRDLKSANVLYNALLTENPNDLETYLSRASMSILIGNNISAAIDVEKALEVLPQDKTGTEKRLSIRAEMAAQFIQSGDYSRGIILLKPTVADGSANIKMQSDYILALRLNGDYKQAIQEATCRWPNFANIPDYGLQALADSYLHTHQFHAAKDIYQVILQRNNQATNLNVIKLGLAYTYLFTDDTAAGLAFYNQVITADHNLADIAIADASAMIEQGKFYAGKQLYNLLLNKFPDNKLYRQRFAAVLAAKNMPREAYEQYAALNELANREPVGLAGIVNTAVTVGDYQTARPAIEYLEEKYSRNPLTGHAIDKYENRSQGSTEFSYKMSNDYKTNDLRAAELTTDQRISDRTSVLAGISNKKIADSTASVTLNSYDIGYQYQDLHRDAKLWIDSYHHHGSFTGYRLLTNYYFGDNANLEFNLERSPVEDPQAIISTLIGPIMATDYHLGFNRQLGLKDFYTLGITTSFYNDTNRALAYNADWTHNMVSSNNKNMDWFTYFSRSSFKHQEINGTATSYESPPLREAYGAGLKERWTRLNDYWEGTLAMEYGRDRPEPFEFSPHIRMEYGYKFSASQWLIAGTEYGLRTNKTADISGFHFSNHQYDINYRMTW